jgi:hypothetical protein
MIALLLSLTTACAPSAVVSEPAQAQGCSKPDADVIKLLTPTGSTGETQPTFAWTAATNMNSSSDYYEFYVWDAADRSHPAPYPISVSSTAWKMDQGRLTRGHRYCWKLRPKNQCGTGNYTADACFSVG